MRPLWFFAATTAAACTTVSCPDPEEPAPAMAAPERTAPADPVMAAEPVAPVTVELRDFGNVGFDECHIPDSPLRVTTDRSNLWLNHYEGGGEEHLRIALPMWISGGRLLVTAFNDHRTLGMIITKDGEAALHVDGRRDGIELRCTVRGI